MRTSVGIKEIAAALAAAQGDIEDAAKKAKNPHFNAAYATLADVKEACRKPLKENNIAVIQAPATNGGGNVTVTTRLLHSSGEWIETEIEATVEANGRQPTSQAIGSCITYLRRYSLMGILNIAAAADDDDGETAMGRGDQKKAPPPLPQTPPQRAVPTVAATFWTGPSLAIPKQKGWVVRDWMASFLVHVDDAPSQVALNDLWKDNKPRIDKLPDQAGEECLAAMTQKLAALTAADSNPLIDQTAKE